MNCELIYMFFNRIESLPRLHNQSISLANKYKIDVTLDEFDYCTDIRMKCKEDIYDNLYSKCVKNMNILVGINGMGKTTILDILGSHRTECKGRLSEWSFFFIYKVDDYFVLEGNDIAFIKNAIENFPADTDEIHPEYSIKCTYDFAKMRFRYFDKCYYSDEVSKGSKVLYYKDRSNEIIRWSQKKWNWDDEREDNYIFVERQVIYPKLLEIANYIRGLQESREWGDFQWRDVDAVISNVGGGRKSFIWDYEGPDFKRKTFVLQFLLAYAASCIESLDESDARELERITYELEDKSVRCLNYDRIDDYLEQVEILYNRPEYQNICNVIDLLHELPDTCFASSSTQGRMLNRRLSCRSIQLNVVDPEYIELIQAMGKIDNISHVLQVSYPSMSAGELKIIDIFSSIESHVGQGNNHYIVLLDEPEKCLHPEMSRRFIYNLNQQATALAQKYNCTFQFLISTHTPFLISDVPKTNIHCLVKDETDLYVIENAKMGLLSNVHDIVKSTFFLEKPVGELADTYFEVLADEIDRLDDNNKYELRKKIDDIDEPTIFAFLNKKYNTKLRERCPKDELIAYYEKQLEKLKGTS